VVCRRSRKTDLYGACLLVLHFYLWDNENGPRMISPDSQMSCSEGDSLFDLRVDADEGVWRTCLFWYV
jgi:hypothetical protein